MRTTDKNKPQPDHTRRALIWDLPLRLFHWALAILFVCSWLTAEAGIEWADAHLYCGYGALALVTFRLLWGLVGTKYARFGQFLKGPRAVMSGFKTLLQSAAPNEPGHSAVGGWASLILMTLVFCQAASGLFITDDILFSGPYNSAVSSDIADALASFHHLNFNVLTAAVGAHLAIMIWYRLRKGHNLVAPMISGYSSDEPTLGAGSSMYGRALLCVSIVTAMLTLLIVFAPEPEYYF